MTHKGLNAQAECQKIRGASALAIEVSLNDARVHFSYQRSTDGQRNELIPLYSQFIGLEPRLKGKCRSTPRILWSQPGHV